MTRRETIIFRADGSALIGMGHFSRTLALANMLKTDFRCVFATQSPTDRQIREIEKICDDLYTLPEDDSHYEIFLKSLNGDEIVVLDNYYYSPDYQLKIKSRGCKVVCIDDIHDKHYFADIVINHAPLSADKFSTEIHTRLLLGFEYALLHPLFLNNKERNKGNDFQSILICFGGTDENNFSQKVLEEIKDDKSIKQITIIVGEKHVHSKIFDTYIDQIKTDINISILRNLSAAEMVNAGRMADVAIVPCSTIMLEMLSLEVPIISGYHTENQYELAKSVENKYDDILMIGDLNKLAINSTHINIMRNRKLSNRASSLFGLQSIANIQRAFFQLGQEYKIKCRKANSFDVDTYFSWANDEDVRMNSISIKPISRKTHEKWYSEKMANNESFLYFFESEKTAVGQTRFDKEGKEVYVDYSIDKKHRGKGYGLSMLRLALEFVGKDLHSTDYNCIVAKVKASNIASMKIFKSLNFFISPNDNSLDNSIAIFKKQIA